MLDRKSVDPPRGPIVQPVAHVVVSTGQVENRNRDTGDWQAISMTPVYTCSIDIPLRFVPARTHPNRFKGLKG